MEAQFRGRQVAMAAIFFTVEPYVCGSPLMNLVFFSHFWCVLSCGRSCNSGKFVNP